MKCVYYWTGGVQGKWMCADWTPTQVEDVTRMGYVCHKGDTNVGPPDDPPSLEERQEIVGDFSSRIAWIRARVKQAKSINADGKVYLKKLEYVAPVYGDNGLRTQVLYILGNCRFPKGSKARKELDAYANG